MNKKDKIKDSQGKMKRLMILIGKMLMSTRKKCLPQLDISIFLIVKPI
jgi:hypothetical protein